jgi:hypothetical protein
MIERMVGSSEKRYLLIQLANYSRTKIYGVTGFS